MRIENASEFVQGHGTLYSFRIRNDFGHIVWSGHGFITERSREQAADVAWAQVKARDAAVKRSHPMVRA